MKVVGIRQVADTNEVFIVSVFQMHKKTDLSIHQVWHFLDIGTMKVSKALTGFRSWALNNLTGRFIIDYADTVNATLRAGTYGYVNTLILITIAIEKKEDAVMFRLYWN